MNNDIEVTTAAEEVEFPAHGSLTETFIQFWLEVFDFFKYIFYDIFLGKSA